MTPKLVLLFGPDALADENVVPGAPRLTWLKVLKVSTRNCNEVRSVIAVVLNIEMANSSAPGERTLDNVRGTFPKVLPGTAGALLKAAVLNHSFLERFAKIGLTPVVKFGRVAYGLLLSPLFAIGKPVWKMAITLAWKPP